MPCVSSGCHNTVEFLASKSYRRKTFVEVIALMQVVNRRNHICDANNNVFGPRIGLISSSAPRPLWDAYVPILLSDVKQEQRIRDTSLKIDSGTICRIIFSKLAFTFGKLGVGKMSFGKLSRIQFLLLRSV